MLGLSSMGQRKHEEQARKLVWRISESSPLGEVVDPAAANPSHPGAKPAPKDRSEVTSGSWVMSSFELLHGAEVNDDPNTVTDELFDELFPQHQAAAKPSKTA